MQARFTGKTCSHGLCPAQLDDTVICSLLPQSSTEHCSPGLSVAALMAAPHRCSGSRFKRLLTTLRPVVSVAEVNLARVLRALEGEVKGGVVAPREWVRGGCGVKGEPPGGILRRAARHGALVPLFSHRMCW